MFLGGKTSKIFLVGYKEKFWVLPPRIWVWSKHKNAPLGSRCGGHCH